MGKVDVDKVMPRGLSPEKKAEIVDIEKGIKDRLSILKEKLDQEKKLRAQNKRSNYKKKKTTVRSVCSDRIEFINSDTGKVTKTKKIPKNVQFFKKEIGKLDNWGV